MKRRAAVPAARQEPGLHACALSAGSAAASLILAVSLMTCALPGSRAYAADEPHAPAYPLGAASFQTNCVVCHGASGAGLPGLAPPLLSYPGRYAASAEGRRQLAMTVLFGMIGEITVEDKHFNFQMPDFARLDDATLAATLNFVLFDLDHVRADVKPITPGEIATERAHPMDGSAVHEHRKTVAPPSP
jgi:mono/diheme cytochrome c family protein